MTVVHRAGTIPERVITLPLSLLRDEPLFTQSGRTYDRLIELIDTACTPSIGAVSHGEHLARTRGTKE